MKNQNFLLLKEILTSIGKRHNKRVDYFGTAISIRLLFWRQNNKIRTSFKSYVAKKARTRRVTIKFSKKLCLSCITWNKKHLSKQVVAVTCTLENFFFLSCYFRRFLSRFFSGRVKKCSVLWFMRVILGFSEKRRPKKYCL